MLKTFMIKRIDYIRNQSIDTIKNAKGAKVKAKGVAGMVKLAGILMVSGAGADEIKDLLLGRDTDLSDRVLENLLRLIGLSKYTVYDAKRSGWGQALVKMATPSTKTVDIGAELLTEGKATRTMDLIPLFGKPMRYWLKDDDDDDDTTSRGRGRRGRRRRRRSR